MPLQTHVDGDRAKLLIYDFIGYDWWSDSGVAATDVMNWLAELGDEISTIHVHINSPGGIVDEGSAIYQALLMADPKIVVHVDGLAASAASVIAMAGDEIRMAETAMLMIHNAWGFAIGDAIKMERVAAVLRKWTSALAKAYVRRTGMSADEVQELLDAETWLDAEEAVAMGFATHIDTGADSEPDDSKAAASWGRSGQRLLASFKRTPERFRTEQRHHPTRIAASATGKKPMNEAARKKLCATLGLPEDAQDDTILAAAEAAANPPAAIEAISEPDLTQWVPRAEFDRVVATVAELEKDGKAGKVDTFLAKHKAKIQSPEYEAALRGQLTSGALSFEAAEQILAATPECRLTKEDDATDAAARATADALGLTELERNYCEKRGMDPAVFAEKKQRRVNKRTLNLVAG